MFRNSSTGAIGIRGLSFTDSLELAAKTGFEGLEFDIREVAALADTQGVDWVRQAFSAAGVLPGSWGLPVAWNSDERWEKDLADLPKLAALGQKLGCNRTATWCPPASDERPFQENLAWHANRFRPIAQVLADHGCRFGIEFIGPKTLRDGHQYEFIYTLEGMMELARTIGTGNVGLLLDAWHLFTSGGTAADLDKISDQDVVLVHVNDAPRGVALDAQIDNVRCLPMETGVIDLPAFMKKLDAMKYSGPVTIEPFSAKLNEIAAKDPFKAAQITAEAMGSLWKSWI